MRALIVDDSPAAREVARAALEAAADELGLDLWVSVAEGGVPALKVLAQEDIAVLLVDLHMPDLHGLEVLSFWRQRPASQGGLAAVVSTAVADRDREKAKTAGAAAFLEKPVSTEALKGLLARWAEGARVAESEGSS